MLEYDGTKSGLIYIVKLYEIMIRDLTKLYERFCQNAVKLTLKMLY